MKFSGELRVGSARSVLVTDGNDKKSICHQHIRARKNSLKIRPPAQSLSNLIPAKMAERNESLNQQVQTILRVKNILAHFMSCMSRELDCIIPISSDSYPIIGS